MNLNLPQPVVTALRIVVAAACCTGIWYSWKFARADYLFHRDTAPSLQAAISLVPDDPIYYLRLSQLDPQHALSLLTTALNENRYDAGVYIELALRYEFDGNDARAEELLKQAYSVDDTYMPRWSLANYYLRHDNMPAFWTWARNAAAMPSDDIGALLALCLRVEDDPAKITAMIGNDNPDFLRQYLRFLLNRSLLSEAAAVAPRLIRAGDKNSDLALLLMLANRSIELNNPSAAISLWHSVVQSGWISTETSFPTNPDFAREPLPVQFDWYFPQTPGLHSVPGPSGLEVEFSGNEPEGCVAAQQVMALTPGSYKLSYSFQSSQIAEGSGIRWQLVDSKTNKILAESQDISSNEPAEGSMAFTVDSDHPLQVLRLVYNRALGTTLVSGELTVVSTRIQSVNL